MKKWAFLILIFAVACSSSTGTQNGSDNGQKNDIEQDVTENINENQDVQEKNDVMGSNSDVVDALDAEVQSDNGPEVEMVTRHFTFKEIGGVSMGAESVVIAANHPEKFDFVASLGGYVDLRYFLKVLTHQIFGGFCPMKQILANLDHIDEKDNPDVFCGPVEPDQPWEWKWDFNHWHADNSGGHWGRKFYWYVFYGITYAYGNLFYYNPENPITPPGVPMDWVLNTPDVQKCSHPYVVTGKYAYNAEYNPEGKYPLITFCDGEPACGPNNKPEWLKCAGNYDPEGPHNIPIYMLLAVDYNHNGKRDYGEPVVINAFERFKDVGTDGCSDEYEDGNGGCADHKVAQAGSDPNHDNFDLMKNPQGTENDHWWEQGEPFDDYGLDGVDNTGDYGEHNGKYDMNPRIEHWVQHSARHFFATADKDVINQTDFMFDGGIRDAIHALTCAYNMTIPLRERGFSFKEFMGLAGRKGSFWPQGKMSEILNSMDKIDYSIKAKGKNFIIGYGDPNASETEILKGDGKHVGTSYQIMGRLVIFMNTAVRRLPDQIIRKGKNFGKIVNSSYYSKVLGARRDYGVFLPPDYEEHPEERYPVVVFLPGHGMDAESIANAGQVFGMFMARKKLPYFILAVPEGQCCYRHKDDLSKRECACWRDGGKYKCVDPQCKAKDEKDCKMREFDSSQLIQECNGGHFFVNFATDRWGDTETAKKKMRFEDSLFEFLDYLDANYRTKKEGDYQVVKEW